MQCHRHPQPFLLMLPFVLIAACCAPSLTAVAEAAAENAARPTGYARLADSPVAEELQLSDDQRAKIAVLLEKRAKALEQTAEAEQADVIAESEKKLSDVLTDAQRTQFAALKPVPKLRFNFRFQKWDGVLQWFAEQADLSLVLDAPPPGTFNYTDSRAYTPSEAIDLLNGVLQTKGYTLIRRKRMLVVIDLKGGVPQGLIPRISLEELEQRGRFELVSVMFPLGGRSAAEVQREVEPLLGAHGKAVALEKTKQLLVTDMAGIMRAIGVVIASIPEPKPAAKPAAAPEKPVLAVYPLKSADPQAATEMLETLIAQAKVVYDPKAEQLSAYATPSQQAVVKRVLEQLQADNPPDKQPRLELYSIDRDQSAETIASLRLAVPGAQLRVDSKTGALVAWGTPDDHEKLKNSLKQLGKGGTIQQTRQVEVYRLTKADPNAVRSLLQELFPNARLSVDVEARKLIAVAVPSDQQAISATLEQLQPAQPGPDTPELRFYTFKKAPPSTFLTVATSLVPRAQITSDRDGKRLTVLASPADHEVISATVERFRKVADEVRPVAKNRLEIYAVTPAQRTRFQAVLQTLQNELPGIRVITDAEPGELAIWAQPKQHAVLAEIIASMKRVVPADQQFELAAYPVKASDPSSALSMLQNLFPSTRIVLDASTRRLLVWTNPAEHEQIKASLEKIVSGGAESQRKFEVYPIRGITVSAAMTTLGPLVPQARLSSDTQTGSVIAWATAEEHKLLQQAVGRLGSATSPQLTRQVEVYRLTKADPNAALALLQGLFPNAQLSVDSQSRSLIAVAVPADQQAIRATLEQLQPAQPGPDAPELKFYPFDKSQTSNAITVLQSLVPAARVTFDEASKRLMVVASPSEHMIVSATVERILSSAVPAEENKLEVYPVTPAQRTRFEAILTSVTSELPGIRVITDAQPGELSIWAKPSQHAVLADILAKLTRDAPATDRYQLVAYPVTVSDPQSAQSVLTELFPGTRIVIDAKTRRLLVWTRPEEHELIRQSMEQINSGASPDMLESLKVYPISDADPNVAMSMLQQLMPELRVSSDTVARTILVWGRKSDHVTVEKTLRQMQEASQSKEQRKVVVYAAGKGDSGALLPVLRSLAPGARIDVHSRLGKVLAWATSKEHEAIQSTIEKLTGAAAGAASEITVYPLKGAEVANAISVLQAVVPEARYNRSADPQRLIVWARADDHETIREVIEKLAVDTTPGDGRALAVFPLHGVSGITLSQVLAPFQQQGAQIVSDATRDSLIVRADKVQLAEIRKAIEDLTKKLPKVERPVSRVYRLQTADPNLAASVLSTLTPQARYTVDQRNRSLIVSAMRPDHTKIQTAFEEIDREADAGDTPVMKSYHVESINPGTLIGMLQSLFSQFPQVRFAADTQSGTVAVLAAPPQQKKIEATIKNLDRSREQVSTKSYLFQRGDPNAAYSMLSALVPNARMTVDNARRALVATATAAAHEQIRQTIEQLDGETDAGATPVMKSYHVESINPGTAVGMLQSLFARFPQVRFVADTQSSTVAVLATPPQQKKIEATIEEFDRSREQVSTKSYRFQRGDPNAAYSMLSVLVPNARMTVDNARRALIATATAAVHEQIRQTIEQLDPAEDDAQAPQLKSYHSKSSDPTHVLGILQTLFASHPDVRLSLDAKNESIVAICSPVHHKTIQEVFAEVDSLEAGVAAATIEVYPLQQRDADSVLSVVTELMQSQSRRVNLSLDRRSNQLVAIAGPEQHEMIRAAIERMQSDALQLEVFQLEVVEPFTAEVAIDRLFGSADGSIIPNAPTVDSDATSQQLFIRATREQLVQIRELLVKMGETQLIASVGKKNIRVLSFDGDTEAAVREITRVWPRLRKNSIRVVVPSAIAPTLRNGKKRDLNPNRSAPRGDDRTRNDKPQDVPEPESSDASDAQAQFSVPPEDADATPKAESAQNGAQRLQGTAPGTPGQLAARQTSQPRRPAAAGAQGTTQPANATPDDQTAESAPPVIIAPGDGRITIASDDLEALDQLESLLRAMSRRAGGSRGRDYVVFSLRNSTAASVATVLQELFRTGRGNRRGSSSVSIVPDERINAILVHGSRADRETIEELLTILDSADTPSSLAGNRPRLIPVRNAPAEMIERVLREIYQAQLTRGGGRQPLPVPIGVSEQVAAAIQRFNAAVSGPLLTLGLDETTNSLVVLAPTTLFEEIEVLVSEMDQNAAEGGTRNLSIIPLKKLNSERMTEALELILGNNGRNRSRSRRRRSR